MTRLCSLDLITWMQWSISLEVNARRYEWWTAGSKLPEKYANAASGPSLQVESKFSYALELVNLEQQKGYYEIQK